jgi:hypothetical protein
MKLITFSTEQELYLAGVDWSWTDGLRRVMW